MKDYRYIHVSFYIFSHFFIHFDAPPQHIKKILEECKRDIDIVRLKIFKQIEPIKQECTFHDEMLPPAYRYDSHFSFTIYDIACNIPINVLF